MTWKSRDNPVMWCGVCVCTRSLSPVVWAELQRSLPARSTRLILLVMLCSCTSPSTSSVCGRADSVSRRASMQKQGRSALVDVVCVLAVVEGTHLSLGHHQGEHGVRSGALIVHSRGRRGSLLVAQLQPTLEKDTMPLGIIKGFYTELQMYCIWCVSMCVSY